MSALLSIRNRLNQTHLPGKKPWSHRSSRNTHFMWGWGFFCICYFCFLAEVVPPKEVIATSRCSVANYLHLGIKPRVSPKSLTGLGVGCSKLVILSSKSRHNPLAAITLASKHTRIFAHSCRPEAYHSVVIMVCGLWQ